MTATYSPLDSLKEAWQRILHLTDRAAELPASSDFGNCVAGVRSAIDAALLRHCSSEGPRSEGLTVTTFSDPALFDDGTPVSVAVTDSTGGEHLYFPRSDGDRDDFLLRTIERNIAALEDQRVSLIRANTAKARPKGRGE